MANTIKIKNSGTASAVPASLEHGELGLNYADGKLYYKNLSNTIVEFSSGGVSSSSLNGLTDVVITSPEEFQGLSYNGTEWVNGHIPVVSYVRNAESTTLTTGTAVYLFGSTGDHASVKRADNDSDTTSSKVIGLVGANIAASQNGPVITRGYVDGIDLSVGYTAGDILWLGEDGGFTKTKPSAPEHLVFLGVVVRATSNGIVYVATQNGYELEELHDVDINPNTLASGDFLKYNGTLWVNDPINLDDLTDVSVPAPSNGDLLVYVGGEVNQWGSSAISSPLSFASLDNIGDVSASEPSAGDFLKWNGSAWVNDAIDLSTDTTGDYVASLVAGTGITITNNSGEGSTPTISAVTARGPTTSITSGASTTIDTFSATSFRSAEYMIQVTQGTKYTVSKVLLIHNGTTATITEYGVVEVGASRIPLTIDATISGGDVLLQATITDAATTNATVKLVETYIEV